MKKESREKTWKAISEKQPINSIDDDIANLNNDDSFVPINEEEEKQPLTEEEKKEVRKKLFILLIVIFIVLVLLIIMLVFDPFEKENTKEKEEPVVEEKEPEKAEDEEKPKEDDVTTTQINQLEDGSIDLNNPEIEELAQEITFNQHDYYENDTLFLYKTDSININNLSNKNKLFLLSKTSEFDSLMKNIIKNEAICDSSLTIEHTSVDEILKDRFNTTITTYDDFIYNYYEENNYIKTIKFTKQADKYVGKCYEPNENIVTVSQQELIAAIKEDKKLYIDYKVVFVRKDGVYKDPSFKTLITNDPNKKLDEYIQSGNTYRYTYDISTSNYYLTNVSLLK